MRRQVVSLFYSNVYLNLVSLSMFVKQSAVFNAIRERHVLYVVDYREFRQRVHTTVSVVSIVVSRMCNYKLVLKAEVRYFPSN